MLIKEVLAVGVIVMVKDEFRDGDTGIYSRSTLAKSGKSRIEFRELRTVGTTQVDVFERSSALLDDSTLRLRA